MPTPTKRKRTPRAPSPAARHAPIKPTPSQRLLHALGNSLSAARLRVDTLTRDPTCMWAQKDNLEALSQILTEAMDEADRLERLLWARR
jgi:hypothetical protein